jgi:hypothetical protein
MILIPPNLGKQYLFEKWQNTYESDVNA